MTVCWNDETGKWKVEYKVGGRTKFFGYYDSIAKARKRNEAVKPRVARMREKWKNTKPSKYGYKKPNGKWTIAEYKYIAETMELPVREVMAHLGKGKNAVTGARYRLRQGKIKL